MSYTVTKRRKVQVNKERLRFIIMVLAVTAVFWLISAALFNVAADGSNSDTLTVVVEEGDTLWSISRDIGYEDDIRRIIFQIKKMNNLQSASIYPGQELIVPSP